MGLLGDKEALNNSVLEMVNKQPPSHNICMEENCLDLEKASRGHP